jgi:translation initiation factor IF-1
MATNERDRLEMDGEVIDSCKGLFKVKTNEGGQFVLCTLSGKIRQNSVKVLVGDSVRIEVGTSDLTKGRIIFRNKS